MSTRRSVNVYVDETRVNRREFNPKTTIVTVKAEAKEGLKQELGLLDNAFHPSSVNHPEVMVLVPSAPAEGSPGLHFPNQSTVFALRSFPQSPPVDSGLAGMIRAVTLMQEEITKDKAAAAALRASDAKELEDYKRKVAEDAKEAAACRANDESKLAAYKRQLANDAKAAAALRKNDEKNMATYKRQVEENQNKLKNTIAALEAQIKRLETQAEDKALDQKRLNDGVKEYILTLAEQVDDATEFLSMGDTQAMDRIKRRNLLDRAQGTLALSFGISKNIRTASLDFRLALGQSSDPQERQRQLLLLQDNIPSSSSEVRGPAGALFKVPEALILLTDPSPKVRLDGNNIAHGRRKRDWYESAVVGSADRVALSALLDFVFGT
ncbi:hypothetical protein GALMADRAFT_213435 [Galerina marginata CBS 339.88]|uniref:Uncharacterized protein n=1 Tax=Galerina marginata (strain CBS 339.88) TaxID=685588 RepID=A0A067SM09_GALM3|nr:hypothetical protein GALMADRAFT_213435 [Galerina marginata CBS 339.88]